MRDIDESCVRVFFFSVGIRHEGRRRVPRRMEETPCRPDLQEQEPRFELMSHFFFSMQILIVFQVF